MPHNRQIPDAPIAGSMLPRASELTLDDLLVLIQPGNPIGQKNKALVLSMLADWLADGNMGPFKTGEIHVGASTWKNVEGVGPSITDLYSLSAGIIEAAVKFKVGDSEWVPGNHQPTISGLYGLEAGNVGTTNLQADTIDAHGEGVTSIQVKKRLVRNNAPGQENDPLLLGPTQVGGGLKVTGSLDAFGGLTLTNHIWNASASDIYSKIDGLGDKQLAFIFNDTSCGITLSPITGSHLRSSFTIPSYAAVQVVCSGQHVYVVGGEYA